MRPAHHSRFSVSTSASVVAIVTVLLVFLLPALAFAATSFVSEYPLGTVHAQPQAVGVIAFGSSALKATTAQITIDGVVSKVQTTVGSSLGHWVYSETGPDANGVYTVRWTWVNDPVRSNQIALTTYPVGAALGDGTHRVVATIKDAANAVQTDTWSYIIAMPPTLGTPTPAANSRVTTFMPVISIPVTDNGPGTMTATATVNGASASAAVSSGVARVASPALPNDATTTVTVTVRDAGGSRASKTWSFYVEVYPEMFSTVGVCANCHVGFETDPDMGPTCSMCHAGQLDHPHQGTPSSFHFKANVTSCSPCHVSDITVEHARWTNHAGAAMTCLTCHSPSASAAVKAAIASGHAQCADCHADTSHESLHTTTVSPACAGAGCHAGTSLTSIHINSGTTLTCATCHSSTNPLVVAAIAGHNRDCTACHGSAGHTAQHDTAVTPACTGSSCHVGTNLLPIHINAGSTLTCDSCHKSSVQAVKDAISSHNKACTACHSASAPHGDNAATHAATPPAATITISGHSFGSHACSECHAPTNLLDLHGNVCATCHPSPKDSATPWAKGCAQGNCHAGTSTKPMHGTIDASHAIPASKAGCLVSGCHSAGASKPFQGKSVAELHSSATTTVAGVTRSGCQICHFTGITLTTDCTSSGCHPERANPHGYDAATHTGTPTAQSFTIAGATYPAIACASCHSTELGVEHTKPTSAGNTGCSECHALLVGQLPPPWNRNTCAQGGCHTPSSAAPMHADITTDHARLSSNAACFASGCHADGSLAAIHSQATTTVAGVTRTSCMVCHADGVPTTKDCTVCHPDKVASHYDAVLHTATFTSGNMTILGVNYGTHACTECHPSAQLGTIHTTGCSTCHPTAVNAAKPWDKTCASVGCHAVGTTKPMHADLNSAHVRPADPTADGCFISGCHTGGTSLAAIHAPKLGCPTCHASGVTPSANCWASGCHADLSTAHPNHTSSGGSGYVSVGMNNDDHGVGEGISANCADCHGSNLVTVHANNCATCHSPTVRAAVKTAITNHVTNCTAACHPSGQHNHSFVAHQSIYDAGGCNCHLVDPYDDPTQVSCSECHTP